MARFYSSLWAGFPGRHDRTGPSPRWTTFLTLATLALTPITRAYNFVPVPSQNLDLSQLGRIGVAGDFDSISLYEWQGQSENGANPNGSQSLLAQYPTGGFATLASSDASIMTMCAFTLSNGSFMGIVVGGNFTSLGGQEAQGIALFDPATSVVTPLQGLSGKVNAVYCDQASSSVFVGGSFTGGNSQNAIMWTTGWTNMPFDGLNGPVTSITKAPSGNIVFGGSFTGLGNGNGTGSSSPEQDLQVVNLGSANISAVGTSSQQGFSDPHNIICKTGSQDGPGNSWLLDDNTPGSWTANFGFGFNPTKLRLYNTDQQGRGTQTFSFTALPINGIMNLTYVDENGQNQTCTNACPLPQNNSTFQDFTFVNTVGMNGFSIDISAWYGSGGGLAGIELFQTDIYSFAVSSFNEPSCDDVSTNGANSTATGPWQTEPSGSSTSAYLSANLQGSPVSPSAASVVFQPDIKQSGNYSITVYTPGCQGDGTCATRGQVTVAGTLASGSTSANPPLSASIYQTNTFDKYDQVYFGYVDAVGSGFRPSITLSPSPNQNGPINIVAQRIRFELLSADAGLNGLFEFNPNQQTVSNDFSGSNIDSAGNSLDRGAFIDSLEVVGSTLYVGGAFSSSNASNVLAITNSSYGALPGGGLNAAVLTSYQDNNVIYYGGNFTATADNHTANVSGIAIYNTSSNEWQSMGGGVNGTVTGIVPVYLNFTANTPTEVISLSGYFTELNAFDNNPAVTVDNFCLWVPSQNNWLINTDLPAPGLRGQLSSQVAFPNSAPLLSGSVTSGSFSASGLIEVSTTGMTLQSMGLNILPDTTSNNSSSSASNSSSSNNSSSHALSFVKRSKTTVDDNDAVGVVTGQFFVENGLNITILAGHFTAKTSNGTELNNLIFVNGSNNDAVTGPGGNISESSTFLSLGNSGNTLYAGGKISGSVDNSSFEGLVLYDVGSNTYPTQPPSLAGPSVLVNAIAPQPSSNNMYIAGAFQSAGSFPCPSLCIWNTMNQQWTSPGVGLGGTVYSLMWASSKNLIVTGNLTVNGVNTTLVTYDTDGKNFTAFRGADQLAGPVTAFAAMDNSYTTFWAGGTSSSDGSAFLQYYDGTNWHDVSTALGANSTIRGLFVLSVTKNHLNTQFLGNDQVLLVTGQLNLDGFGNASSAVYNGTNMAPYLLSNMEDGSPGSLSTIFVQNTDNLLKNTGGKKLAVGFVVLIALAIALGLTFLFCLVLLLIERQRKKRQGYAPLATNYDRNKAMNVGRIPPEHLFGSVGQNGREKAPQI